MKYEAIPGHIGLFARGEMERTGVPGVAVGVIAGGRWYATGYGVTSLRNPLSVTPETLFQVGSTSKTYAATAIMALAEEGRLDIEERVRTYLPEFRLKSEADAAIVTVRHLLTHHGGWVGDYFKDMGDNDDALALMVEKMADAPQVTPAGFAFAYSNAAFNVLARIVEVVSGEGYEAYIGRRFLEPLGMKQTTYFANEAIVHRVAMGHLETAEGPRVSGHWRINRSIAGSSGVVSSVLDQLGWAAFHMGGGSGVLKDETLRAMQSKQAEAGSMCEAFGFGWMLDTVGGEQLAKHGGSINGQLSSFEFIPALGYACTVLTNCDTGREVRDTVAAACMEHFTGMKRTLPAPDASLTGTLREFVGRYKQRMVELEVKAEGDTLWVHDRQAAWIAALEPRAVDPPPAPMQLFAPDRAVVTEGAHRGETAEFIRAGSGQVAWMRWDGRLSARIQS
ncbi:MAG: serine hydrolase domain-containing protein [Dehalococcoidia bacterium]|nr:beta-lactamase family protein [Dehalococcoidia bacterium]MCB9486425.1 beta-lactamase family protein [Thermoflexaceae bacterium]